MGKLICITGIDGSGKNTLIKGLTDKLGSVKAANIWDIMDSGIANVPFKSKKDIDGYLCELTADSRLFFLAHALKFSIDLALKSDKEYILLNAYYYKYFATELTLGANPNLVNSLIKNFPVPDKVIMLNISVEEASKRKEYLSRYECGLSAKPNRTDFLNFQDKAIQFWDTFNKDNWVILNAANSPEDIVVDTLKAISGK